MKKVLSILLVIAMMLTFSACGADGKDGKDGVTPTIEISDDGYWVINGEKTDVKATPENAEDDNPQGLQFYLQDDGTYIVSCGDAKYLSNIVIPATYKGGAVVGIDDSAFNGCKSLTNITIPNSITSIGNYAFQGCTSLESITIPSSVTEIGNDVFDNCGSLTNITIPNSVTKIGEWCDFSGCTLLTTIKFEGTVERWHSLNIIFVLNSNNPTINVVCSDGVVTLK